MTYATTKDYLTLTMINHKICGGVGLSLGEVIEISDPPHPKSGGDYNLETKEGDYEPTQ